MVDQDDPSGGTGALPVLTRGLTKQFRHQTAVNAVDLAVPAGAVYGFLGPNGSGKTTTIRMLLGLVKPTDGTVRVHGQAINPGATDWLREVGSLVETAAAYPNLTVAENLDVHRRLTGTSARRVSRVVDQLGLGPVNDRR